MLLNTKVSKQLRYPSLSDHQWFRPCEIRLLSHWNILVLWSELCRGAEEEIRWKSVSDFWEEGGEEEVVVGFHRQAMLHCLSSAKSWIRGLRYLEESCAKGGASRTAFNITNLAQHDHVLYNKTFCQRKNNLLIDGGTLMKYKCSSETPLLIYSHICTLVSCGANLKNKRVTLLLGQDHEICSNQPARSSDVPMHSSDAGDTVETCRG